MSYSETMSEEETKPEEWIEDIGDRSGEIKRRSISIQLETDTRRRLYAPRRDSDPSRQFDCSILPKRAARSEEQQPVRNQPQVNSHERETIANEQPSYGRKIGYNPDTESTVPPTGRLSTLFNRVNGRLRSSDETSSNYTSPAIGRTSPTEQVIPMVKDGITLYQTRSLSPSKRRHVSSGSDEEAIAIMIQDKRKKQGSESGSFKPVPDPKNPRTPAREIPKPRGFPPWISPANREQNPSYNYQKQRGLVQARPSSMRMQVAANQPVTAIARDRQVEKRLSSNLAEPSTGWESALRPTGQANPRITTLPGLIAHRCIVDQLKTLEKEGYDSVWEAVLCNRSVLSPPSLPSCSQAPRGRPPIYRYSPFQEQEITVSSQDESLQPFSPQPALAEQGEASASKGGKIHSVVRFTKHYFELAVQTPLTWCRNASPASMWVESDSEESSNEESDDEELEANVSSLGEKHHRSRQDDNDFGFGGPLLTGVSYPETSRIEAVPEINDEKTDTGPIRIPPTPILARQQLHRPIWVDGHAASNGFDDSLYEA